jgi:hypothetical protein
MVESLTLPSFLYLPQEGELPHLQGRQAHQDAWIVGRLAREKAAETPGRVAHSAKSWLCHHAADRTAPFLPWGSDDVPGAQKISPVRASAFLLSHLRDAWNDRFAGAGADFAFDSQLITITVPASFDAAAQKLTLAAAAEAGFPKTVRLLEEPQAVFYRWLEEHDSGRHVWDQVALAGAGPHHVLVVDVGGGTSDFSLFELESGAGNGSPRITRIAVSNHILLGGDNMDLAIAHRLESRFVDESQALSGVGWELLVAGCRDVKEKALSSEGRPDQLFTITLAGRGSSLIGGARSVSITRAEIEALVLGGFFPECYADEGPIRKRTALGEWGLPYAADPGVTRHLADFLQDRPPVAAVLFNGGSLSPRAVRERICREIGKWQGRPPPIVLENSEPRLAVARGAARFGKIVHARTERIEGGTAHAIFLEAHRTASAAFDEQAEPSLVCVLPHGARSEVAMEITNLALELRINRPVRFRTYYSALHGSTKAGDVVAWNERDFHPLPALETVAKAHLPAALTDRAVPVNLTARLNELGLLEVSCRSVDPAIRASWPLEFNLRSAQTTMATASGPNVSADALDAGRRRIQTLFDQALNHRDKLTATRLVKSLETIVGVPKSEWNVVLIRSFWSTLERCIDSRRRSPEHEEAWLILAGFMLRPGFGAALDELRIDRLWTLRETGLFFSSKAVKLQEYILWRRVGGGLSRERQESVLGPELAKIREQKSPSPELVLLAGSLERIGREAKEDLIARFIDAAAAHAAQKKHNAHFLAALGLLLNRTPLYAGPETVVSPELVEHAFDVLSRLDWTGPKLMELQTLFLRAARVVNNRNLDVSKGLRNKIADKLEKSGLPAAKTIPLRQYVALELSDSVNLFGESLPPGLILRGS